MTIFVDGFGERLPFASVPEAQRALELAIGTIKTDAGGAIAVCDHTQGKYFCWTRGGDIFRPRIVEVDDEG